MELRNIDYLKIKSLEHVSHFGTWTALSTIMALRSNTVQQNKAEQKNAFWKSFSFAVYHVTCPFIAHQGGQRADLATSEQD